MGGFNPCFPGSSAERKKRLPGRGDGGVSILVFLDQALKAKSAGLSFWAQMRFNPCFPGSSAESQYRPDHRRGHPGVSILVFLDQALKEPARRGFSRSMNMFQSLFSWIKR